MLIGPFRIVRELDGFYTHYMMEQPLSDDPSVLMALIATFIFQGTYLVMGIYMFLVYLQAKKKDYLLYSIYLLLFSGYFFVRIDQTLMSGLLVEDEDAAFYFTTPLLFLITGIYIDFINTFAKIDRYNERFSREVRFFAKIMYALSVLTVAYLVITSDLDSAKTYLRPVFSLVHLYAVYLVIRAFVVIKSKLRYYVLAANFFLIALTALGLNTAADLAFREGIHSNTLWGFYPMNASQLGVFLEMVCFALGLGHKFNQIELEKEKIKKLDLVKTQLYTNISHEIRTPLTLILGPVENQLGKPELSPEDEDELLLIKTNADRLLKLVDQMLDLSIIDSGQRVLRVDRGNMAVIIRQLVGAFQYRANARNIRIQAAISGLDDVWFDRDVLEKVGANLLSNATKYALDHSIIVLDARKVDGQAVLSVTNSIKSSKATDLNRLFQRFYQEDEAAPGVGVGLALVKELVELAQGRIEVAQRGGHCLCFVVTLPVERQAFPSKKLVSTQAVALEEGNPMEASSYRGTVLIVEDEDEIREFIASLFRREYRVLLASNGKEGFDRAIKTMPEVVITDVMMPEMNGMELCQLLKTHVMTSHIPVLMLTARADETHELAAYENGADTYLTKPFHSAILQLKIKNLLADQQRLRQRYSESFSIDPDRAVNKTEEDFLSKLKSVCEAHLAEPELTAEGLAALMNTSRTQLHRKLQGVFGTSATGFIRTQRIKLACGLLSYGKDETISKIAYQVGFSTVSYFNKCFKEQMGCTPIEYIQKPFKNVPNKSL